jgi:hypothetical protein
MLLQQTVPRGAECCTSMDHDFDSEQVLRQMIILRSIVHVKFTLELYSDAPNCQESFMHDWSEVGTVIPNKNQQPERVCDKGLVFGKVKSLNQVKYCL